MRASNELMRTLNQLLRRLIQLIISSSNWRYLKLFEIQKKAFRFIWFILAHRFVRRCLSDSTVYICICVFVIISPLNRTDSFVWINSDSLYTRMICAKFDWKWSVGSGDFLFILNLSSF
jgi:hypothetical protein